jgi:transcriptional regulator NrdR family protein
MPNDRTNQILRRRECIKCGARFSTLENIRDPKAGKYQTPEPRRILDK